MSDGTTACPYCRGVLLEGPDYAPGVDPESVVRDLMGHLAHARCIPQADHDAGEKLAAAMKAICDEIPARFNIVAFLREAHPRLAEAAGPKVPAVFVNEKLVEVLREIATHAVEEFTRRTGQPFLWQDGPDPFAEDPVMPVGLDDKGNVVLDNGAGT